jgi:hypothetical protein
MNPMSPAIMDVKSDSKTMMWPLTFAAPGEECAVLPKLSEETSSTLVERITIPPTLVAVARFSNASIEPVVRKAARELRTACQRDGLALEEQDDAVQFCQYDAIFSMGKRRGEVWIPLQEGQHPWSK